MGRGWARNGSGLMDNSDNHSLRVCHLISSFRPIIGGAERATERLCATLVKDGVDTIVLTRRQSRNTLRFEMIDGIPVQRLGFPVRSKLGALSFALHGFWLLATKYRPYILIHAQSPDTPLLLGFLAKVFLKRKLLLTIHGESRILGLINDVWGRLRIKMMIRLVDCFTSIAPEITGQLQLLAVPVSRIVAIPNGIDTKKYSPPTKAQITGARQQLQLPLTGNTILFLGRLVEFKRVDLLLHAWAHLSKHQHDQLLIVGAGPELHYLESLACRLGISVRFEGPTDDVLTYLQAADIFVLPSGIRSTSSYEGLSVALMEAMSTGLAVVATDCAGNRVLIQDGYNGLLFPVEDADGLAKQLGCLLDDPAMRQRLGQSAHTSVYRDYAIEAVARKTKAIYEQIQVGKV